MNFVPTVTLSKQQITKCTLSMLLIISKKIHPVNGIDMRNMRTQKVSVGGGAK